MLAEFIANETAETSVAYHKHLERYRDVKLLIQDCFSRQVDLIRSLPRKDK